MTVYVVPATIVRVVDGRTIECNLDLGWHVVRRSSLIEIDLIEVPCLASQAGKAARKHLQDLLDQLPRRATLTSRRLDSFHTARAAVYIEGLGDLAQLLLNSEHAQGTAA